MKFNFRLLEALMTVFLSLSGWKFIQKYLLNIFGTLSPAERVILLIQKVHPKVSVKYFWHSFISWCLLNIIPFPEICSNPGIPMNGFKTGPRVPLSGDKITFSCKANYDLVGSKEIFCYEGTWNGSVPQCFGELAYINTLKFHWFHW